MAARAPRPARYPPTCSPPPVTGAPAAASLRPCPSRQGSITSRTARGGGGQHRPCPPARLSGLANGAAPRVQALPPATRPAQTQEAGSIQPAGWLSSRNPPRSSEFNRSSCGAREAAAGGAGLHTPRRGCGGFSRRPLAPVPQEGAAGPAPPPPSASGSQPAAPPPLPARGSPDTPSSSDLLSLRTNLQQFILTNKGPTGLPSRLVKIAG
ncbi:nascent polypeptide-associated complex subunit alpha, muscle-specific form-like [Falco naumanni]|uniref:nascent polypeptide-associated complex subunit alpha, muscle-specific form-like n=1 Tax=Falco naumanni TaxID=148594 RepID=UPI001ADE9176|nr:nascent polypeptide-associated complex subunit alpha, muscle-specific form-like [Falco naumanni]